MHPLYGEFGSQTPMFILKVDKTPTSIGGE